MKKKQKLYTKLPGVTHKNFGKHTLWQGKDHLLLMYSNGMSEDYKRFYYKDILGIVITKTRKAAVTFSIILGLFLLTSFFSWKIWSHDQEPASAFLGIIAFVFLAFLLSLIIKGPSCECRIITAVQNEKLPAVSLIRHARKLMTILKPIILEAQGAMAPDDVANAMDTLVETQRAIEPDRHPKSGGSAPELTDNAKPRKLFHFAMFSSLVLYGIMVGLSLPQRTMLLVSVTYIFLFIAGLSSAGALTVHAKSRFAPSLKKIAWAGLIFVMIAFVQSYGEIMVFFFIKTAQGKPPLSQMDMFQHYYSLRPLDFSVVKVADCLKIFVAAVIGIPGLFLLTGSRN
ncbi:MAG: hypothetical protein WC799_06420 [Desulfobacteraceae bacterium]|jgi:hypothetical protein